MDTPARIATTAPTAAARPVAGSRARAWSRGLRAMLSWLHLWVGLVAGTVFALVGLSGSVLVFHDDLLQWQHPELAGHELRADGDVLARILHEWQPQGLGSVHLPEPDGVPTWQGYFGDGRRGYFDPADGELLLMRSADDDWLMWLHDFHIELLGGDVGKEVLGVIGWIAVGLLLSGLYLWWPKAGRWLAQLKMHRGPPVRRWLSWHRSSGVLLLPLLLLATLTGVGMIYHAGFRAVLTGAFGGDAPPAAPQVAIADDHAVDWPRVLALAATALPGARLTRTGAPEPGSDVVAFRARSDGEWHPNGRSLVHVDRAGSRVLLAYDATDQRPGARMTEAIYPLHIGSVGGAAYKWATAIAGLLPTFLLVTGFLFWRRRRGKR